jgi:TolA-binding protein
MRRVARPRVILLATALMLSLLAVRGWADTTYVNVDLVPYGTITGTATGTGLSNHSGIFVYVGGTSIVGVTNATGNYSIVGVPYGTYTLTFTKNGFADGSVSGVTISLAGQVVNVSSVNLIGSSADEAALFGQALRLFSYDRIPECIAALRSLISAYPTGRYAASSYYRIGLAFGQQNEYDSAITAFTSVITGFSTDSLAADAYYWRGAYKDSKLNYAGALADFQYIVAHFATYPIAGRAQYRIGREYEGLKNDASAITAYLAVETSYPTSPDISQAIFNAGWLYYGSDQYASARTEFDKLLTSYPATAEASKASFYKGMTYYNQENFSSALTAFAASITNYPLGDKIVDAWYYQASCKFQLESYTFVQAKADFQHIVDFFPTSQNAPHSRYYLGSCEYDQGNGSAAIAAYQAYLTAEPNNDWVPNARYKIANAYYFSVLDYTSALSAFIAYYTAYPTKKDAGDAHYYAGRCYEKLNGSTNNAQAAAEYCIVMRQFPNCSKAADATTRFSTVGGTTCP